ncbi:MAG: exopolyphosphatase [Bacteroidota bacterium]
MKQKIAVIDLGTNTFHLLIVSVEDGQFSTLYRERRFIKLAEQGIETIGASAYNRAMEAMTAYAKILKEHQVEECQAFGTAALRTASNGPQFIEDVLQETGIQIQLIDGQREAGLIHKGVALAVPFAKHPILIMDIGGGSVEFIIANEDQVFWAQSFPIGVAVLHRSFHQHDPITDAEKAALLSFLEQTLKPLKVALERYPCHELAGASGTFDVLENILSEDRCGPHCAEIAAHKLQKISTEIISNALPERLLIPGLPKERADLIVVAMLLIEYVCQLADIDTIYVSAFAMKEGMIAELMQK